MRLFLAMAPALLSLSVLGWALTYSPFVRPMAERGTEELRLMLERAVAAQATADWIVPRLEAALASDDIDRSAMLLELAADHSVTLPPELIAEATARAEAASGWRAWAADCSVCAFDITSCRTPAQLGACAVPVELSPAGDANALRRAAVAAIRGEDVDELDAGLALVGLAATGTVVFSAGSSISVKAGAGLFRLARRLGTLSDSFLGHLRQLADIPVRWSAIPAYTIGRVDLSQVTDTAKLARLAEVFSDLGTLRRNTSSAEALLLLRHVDTPRDAARLARVSEAMGPDTPRTVEVLGARRTLALTTRFADGFLTALAAIYALGLNLLLLCAERCGRASLKLVRRVATS